MRKGLFLLTLLLVATTMNVVAQNFTYNYRGIDFKCKVKNGNVIIKGYDVNAAIAVIPAEVIDPKTGRTYAVSTVDLFTEVAAYKTSSLAIEKGITEIAECCFSTFRNLNSISIPVSVEKIGKKAFNKNHMPSFQMPSTIKEEDLRNGLVVYPHVPDGSNVVSMADYTDSTSQMSVSRENNEVAKREITPGTSDIDINIPSSKLERENTFCIIIANEKYLKKDTPQVKYAAQDGKTFYNYCTKTLGMPRDNVKMLTNATYLQMKNQMNWLSKVADIYGNDANFIVYYAGHGVPDEKGNCKLMPVDVSINDVDNGFSLKDLYSTLSNITTQSALVLVDACFSGNDRGNVCVLDDLHRGIVRDVKKEKIGGNVVVMTAATNTETALAYDEKGHGLFSYYLMRKIQETKGNVTYGELFDYVNKEVKRKSTVSLDKTQTPSVACSNNLSNTWRDIKF